MDTQQTHTVIIGASAAGLAVGCCLRRASIPFVMLEQHRCVGAAWRNHYDRLRLHTSRCDFADQRRERFDAAMAATGDRPALDDFTAAMTGGDRSVRHPIGQRGRIRPSGRVLLGILCRSNWYAARDRP